MGWLTTTLRGAMVGALMWSAPAMAADPAADFTLRDIDGASHTLSDLEGRVVIMSFWATWCGPCKEEMPHLQKMYADLESEGLTVLSISIDDARSASRVKPFIKKNGYSFPVLLDRDATVISSYNPSKTLPYTVVVDREGNVFKKHSGYNPGDEEELREEVTKLLAAGAEAPAPEAEGTPAP
jgi:peroxiredoxin